MSSNDDLPGSGRRVVDAERVIREAIDALGRGIPADDVIEPALVAVGLARIPEGAALTAFARGPLLEQIRLVLGPSAADSVDARLRPALAALEAIHGAAVAADARPTPRSVRPASRRR